MGIVSVTLIDNIVFSDCRTRRVNNETLLSVMVAGNEWKDIREGAFRTLRGGSHQVSDLVQYPNRTTEQYGL